MSENTEAQAQDPQVQALPLSESDMRAARQFADGCYDDSVRRPSAAAMERLERAGVVQRLPRGGWAETPRLRQLGI